MVADPYAEADKKGSTLVRQENGITLITHQKKIAPFSWMKFVVISEKDLKENGEEILTHEYAHIRKKHSIDLLIADISDLFPMVQSCLLVIETGTTEHTRVRSGRKRDCTRY